MTSSTVAPAPVNNDQNIQLANVDTLSKVHIPTNTKKILNMIGIVLCIVYLSCCTLKTKQNYLYCKG